MSGAPALGTRRVLVTGAGSGIGRAVAEALLARGGQVALVGRRAEKLAPLAEQHPGRAHVLACDLADPAARAGLLARARALLGGLDGLVHSAGTVVHQAPGHIDEASLREQLQVNLVAPLRLGEEALEVLEPGGGMVFVASTLAVRPVVTSAAYSASKAGLLQVVKVLALAGAPRGVRAAAVVPGGVDTDMVRARGEAGVAALAALHPLGRLGRPEEVADTVVHLLGAAWATGCAWELDGGLLLRE